MIIYDPHQQYNLADFGIKIPAHTHTAARLFAALLNHAQLGPRIDRWHIARIDEAITREDLLRAHSREYVDRLFSERLAEEIIRTYELVDEEGNYRRYDPNDARQPLPAMFGRILARTAQSVQCCRLALEKKFCFTFGGGMHHAHRNYGAGFCLVNDIVIAVRKLQAEGRVNTAWVIDLDAHKGDGTAALTRGDDTIKTLSIHMAAGWPLDGDRIDRRGRLNPSFIPSDIDIPIARGEEHRYAARLQEGLNTLKRSPRPDLALVVAGADPYEKDELPSTADLRLSLAQMEERDFLVYDFLRNLEVPQAYLMAGGYGPHCWEVYARFLPRALLDHLG